MSIFLLSLTLEVFYFVLCVYTETITAPESPSMALFQPSLLAATPFMVNFFPNWTINYVPILCLYYRMWKVFPEDL